MEPRAELVDGMLVERDAAVAMRDGVRIFVDVFRRPAGPPAPVIVAWSPYGKHAPVSYDLFPNSGVRKEWVSRHAGFEGPDPAYWVAHGYCVINVDPRGQVVPVEIEIWPSGTRFGAGESLRLVVAGGDIYRYPEPVVSMAHDTINAGSHVIRTGGRYDSHLLVPVT